MKTAGADLALITPAADGWLLHGGGATRPVPTLEEAAALLPEEHAVHLALPCQALIIEGLKLPATQRDELAGMIHLQLEKNLPYPLEDISSEFLVIESDAKESSVISVAAPHETLDAMCAPLRERGRLPVRLTPFVLHVAAACPAGETVLVIYPEQGQLVVAICAAGSLRWAHVVAGTDHPRLTAELPQVLLAAAMDGAPTTFSRLLLAPACRALEPALRAAVSVPVAPLPAAAPALAAPINLVPRSWRSDADRLRSGQRHRRQLQIAAVLYALLVLAAFVYLVILRRQAAQIGALSAATRPQLERIQAQQARSNALAPAFDPARSTVETLFLVQNALPEESVRITEFDQQPGQWQIKGEAPSARLAIDYVARLKAQEGLAAFEITAGPPQVLPNDHWQFGIFGKR